MVGHKFYLSDEYSSHERQELMENYKIVEQKLLIYDENKEIKQLQKEHDDKMIKLEKYIKILEAKVDKMPKRFVKQLTDKQQKEFIRQLKEGEVELEGEDLE